MYIKINNQSIKAKGDIVVDEPVLALAARLIPREPISLASICYSSLDNLNEKNPFIADDFSFNFEMTPSDISNLYTEAYELFKTKIIYETGWSDSDVLIVVE